jgi:hypothetical protein
MMMRKLEMDARKAQCCRQSTEKSRSEEIVAEAKRIIDARLHDK